MARIVITRPNGETEYAECAEKKPEEKEQYLTVTKEDKTYYAALGNALSTHMFVITPDGRKLYVQKALETLVTFDYTSYGEGDPARLDFRMIDPKPKTINGVTLHSLQKAESGEDTKIILYLNERWTGSITVTLKGMQATFAYRDTYSSSCDVGSDGIDAITTYAGHTPFKVTVIPG